ncbi:MAG TPA: divalent metal cation transporter [Terriglobales bacterium]|nr:divalent metal cation transporter [Terriglobales bacterium]
MSSQKFDKPIQDSPGQVVPWPKQEGEPALPPAAPRPPVRFGALRKLGPGIVTGAANVDPSLIVTATVVGAAFHFSLLWVVVLCVPILLAVFAVSGRLGYQTRMGLVHLLQENYGRKVALACALLIVVINLAMIVADLMAVSDAFSIILGQTRMLFVAATAFSIWYILIFRDYRRITDVLVWLSLPLFVYVISAVLAAPSPAQVALRTLVPRVQGGVQYVDAIVGIFGSLLTPYVIVWQTSSRREQAMIGDEASHDAQSRAGTVVSTLLAYCVMLSAASVLRLPHAVDMTTTQAAEALRPAVGGFGPILFSIGIIGAGMVALPVLVASMCYSIAEAMGWRSGLSEHPWDAKSFYVLISLCMLAAVVLNFTPINPVKALYWSQILAGALTVPILLSILVLSNDRRIMRTANTFWQNFWIGGAIGGLIAIGAVLLAWRL